MSLPEQGHYLRYRALLRENFVKRALVREALKTITISKNSRLILWAAAFISAVFGSLYGYDTGIISGSLLLMSQDFSLTSFQQEMIVSSILVGAVIGAVGASWFSERYGQRISVILVAAIFGVGAIMCAKADSVGLLMAARAFLGLAVGGSTQAVPSYISELAPAARRGSFVTVFNVAIGIGILIANLVGFFLREAWGWRPMIAVAAVPAFVVLISMFFLPNSPRWTAEHEGLQSAAIQLGRVRHSRKMIRDELSEIQEKLEEKDERECGWSGLKLPWIRPALIAALGTAFFTQACGLEMMIYYTPTLLFDAGFGKSSALLTSLATASIYLIMTVMGSLLVDRIGRRRLTLVMGPLSAMCLVALGIIFNMDPAIGSVGNSLIIPLLMLFMAANSGGIQVVGWLLGAEIFPQSMRAIATGVHASVLWAANLLVTSTLLTLVQSISLAGTMLFYAAINVISVLFIYCCIPETSGATLGDIETALRRDEFRPSSARNFRVPRYPNAMIS